MVWYAILFLQCPNCNCDNEVANKLLEKSRRRGWREELSEDDKTEAQKSCRILIITSSPDSAAEFNQLMNCIFSAQKLRISIDALAFTGAHIGTMPSSSSSSGPMAFLQQACLLTEGIYQELCDDRDALLSLLHHFLPSPLARASVRTPLQVSAHDDADDDKYGDGGENDERR